MNEAIARTILRVKLSGSGGRARSLRRSYRPSSAATVEQVFPGVARIIVEHQLTGQVNVEAERYCAAASAISAKCLWVMNDKPACANLKASDTRKTLTRNKLISRT